MAITNRDQLLNALGNTAQTFTINKASIANATAGLPMSLWRATGTPGQGAIPGAAALCTKALTGAFAFNNPSSGNSYLARMALMAAVTGAEFQIHDRLAHRDGRDGTLTTSQTVNVDVPGSGSNMANRRGASNYSEVQWWLEIYTDVGTTARTATITYTNAAGTSGRTTTVAIGSTTNSQNRAGRLLPIIGSGGAFIQSVQSVQRDLSTGAAGSFGVTATRMLTGSAIGLANVAVSSDWQALGFPRVHDDACLQFVCFPGSTTTGALYGTAKLAQG